MDNTNLLLTILLCPILLMIYFHSFVVDTTPPVLLSCPSNITVTVDVGQESVAVSWQPPTAEDLGGQVFQSDMLNPNDTFMIGVTEVVYEFADAANNRVSCTFTITVVECKQKIEPSRCFFLLHINATLTRNK